MQFMKKNALIIAHDNLQTVYGKTAHGLIRYCERFNIVGVIDPASVGKNLNELVPGCQEIPIFKNIQHALQELQIKPDYCITGIVTHGGIIPDYLNQIFEDAISSGLSIINGLHQFLNDNPALSKLAKQNGVELLDIRKPNRKNELKFWEGKILQVKCPIVAVLGTDCVLGKRTTTRLLLEELKQHSVRAEMIYTGQTGWLQGGNYGFIFDATPNDFVSGEIEHCIYECWQQEQPEIILIEGQASLRNPSGPAGAEFILSGNAKAVILQHASRRKYFCGSEDLKLEIPSLESEINLIEAYGAEVIGICLNTENLPPEELLFEQQQLMAKVGRPVVCPLESGVEELVEILKDLIN